MLLRFGTTEIDLIAHQVRSPEGTRDLTRQEVEVLRYLGQRRGQVVLREAVEREVWGFRAGVRSEAVPVAMRRLRAKLGRDDIVSVVTGRGWRLEADAAAPALPPLPRFDTPLTGREALLEAIAGCWERGWRVLTLRGPGGVGKTRVLWEAARRWPGTPVALALDEPATASGLRDRLAAALRLEASDPDTLRRWFASLDRPLLVVDDADVAPEAVKDLVESIGAAALLAGRAPVDVVGETVIEVPPLAPDDARTFFVDRLRGARPRGAAEAAALDAVVERLDRLPLALELFAPEAALGLGTLAEALADPAFLGPLHGVVERSWATLPEPVRDVLLACSAYAGPFPLAAGLAAGDRDALSLLRDRSLVHVDPEGRFHVLRTVRSFCRAQEGFAAAASRAHRWVRDEAERLAAILVERPSEAVAGVLAILPHVERVAREASPDDAARAALAAAAILEHTGPDATTLALLESVDRGALGPDRAAAMRVAVATFRYHGRRPTQDVLALLDGIDTPDAESLRCLEAHLSGRSADALAGLDALDGRFAERDPARVVARIRAYWCAFECGVAIAERGARADAAVDLAERVAARPVLPHALRVRAHHRALIGDASGARADLGLAMHLAEENGQYRLVPWLWGTLGQIELRHDVEAAVTALRRAVQLARVRGDAFQYQATIQWIGCAILLDRHEEALALVEPVLQAGVVRPRLRALALAYRGAAWLATGRVPEGRLALDAVRPHDLAFGAPGATADLGRAFLDLLRVEEWVPAARRGDPTAVEAVRRAVAEAAPIASTAAGEEALGLLLRRLRSIS